MAIGMKGGNKVVIAQLVASTYALLAAYTYGTHCFKIPNVSTSGYTTDLSTEEIESEEEVVVASDSKRKVKFHADVIDNDKTTIDFLSFGVNAFPEYALVYSYRGIVGGKWQEFFSIAKVHGQANQTSPDRGSGKFDGSSIAPAASVTWTSGAIAVLAAVLTPYGVVIRTTSDVTIAANREFVLTETTVT